MKAGLLRIPVFLVLLLALIPSAFAVKQIKYTNTKYFYSLEYPANWILSFLGDGENSAVVLRICSDQTDTSFDDVGNMKPRVEITVSDIGELMKLGAKIPPVNSAAEWLKWERSNWDAEEKNGIGPFTDTAIIVGDHEGVMTVSENFRIVVASH